LTDLAAPFLSDGAGCETNKPLHPVAMGTFRAQTVMFHPQGIQHLFEQPFGLARGNRRRYDCH